MDNLEKTVKIMLCSDQLNTFTSLLESMHSLIQSSTRTVNSIASDMIDEEFLEEIESNVNNGTPTYFGSTLRELKCVITDDDELRQHTIYFKYNARKKLVVTEVCLPHTPLLDRDYTTMEEIVTTFTAHVNSLAAYFHELDSIGQFCTVMEPLKPTYKENYRRILLDERTWLHIEVTPDGLATNIHLVGQTEHWQEMLQVGLLIWDHDKDIVENVTTMFDLAHFPVLENKTDIPTIEGTVDVAVKKPQCGICLCSELPGDTALPQPLCQNTLCGVSFHRNCLFQWLVACSGGRPPTFGVATGSCPACLQTISCTEKDN